MKKLTLLLLTLFAHATTVRAADGALSFNPASSQYVEVPNFHTLGVTNEVTIEFWALTNAVGNHSAFMLETDDGLNRCQMHTAYSDGKTYWDFGNTSGSGRLSVTTPSDTEDIWTHWAVVASSAGNFMKIYRDGVEVATKTGMSAFNVSTARTLRIGGNTGLFFNGQLDEFRVWNVARPAADIAAHRNLALSGGEAGLRLYLRFDEVSGTTALNSATATGAAYHGTLVNAPARSTGINATFTVTTTAGSGIGSLRRAIADANAAPGTNTILFDSALSGQTIAFAGSNVPTFTDANRTTVDGTALTSPVTLSGTGVTRILHLDSGASVTLKKLILTAGNGVDTAIATGHGGAIYSQGTLAVEDCVFTNNTVTGDGGAIRCTPSAPLTVTRCTFTGNTSGTASHFGGAIFSQSPVLITRSTFSGNTSYRGGAVRAENSTITASQSTFTGNTASIGAALSFGGIGGASSLTHVTISGNNASLSGGGIQSDQDAGFTLENSIVSANTAPTAADIENLDPLTYVGANLVQTVVNTAAGTVTGPAPSAAAPLLATLGNYGGPTPTMPPLTGSPAMDAAIGSTITTDQRGASIAGTADIGAYEYGGFGPLAPFSIAEDTTGTFGIILPSPGPEGLALATFSASASSNNATLLPPGSITVTGTGLTRTVTATPAANVFGTVTVFLSFTDGTSTAGTSFLLTVTPVDDAPTLNGISNVMLAPSAGLQTVNLTGIGTGAANETQTLSITATSSNPAFIPHPSVNYTSPAATGFITFTPAAGQRGFALITVTVSDGTSSISRAFYVSVPNNSASQVIHNGDSGSGSLRQAIANALAATGSQSITFDAVLSGQTIVLSSEIMLNDGNNSNADVFTINATSLPGGLTLDGGPGTNRIFSLPFDDSANLRGLTLTGGNGTGAQNSGSGGAIISRGTLTLTHCTLSGNSAKGNSAENFGGAIYNQGGGTLTLMQCTLSGNSAGFGGAIVNFGTLALTQCTLSGNSADISGGAILNDGTLALTQCTLSGNTASSSGGAIYNQSDGTLTLTQCTLSGNSATRDGGAINNTGTLTLTQCTLSGNTATRDGGAINNTGTLTLTQCTLSGNTATGTGFGGAIVNFGTLTLTKCTLSGNSASSSGGAIYNLDGGTLTLTSSLIAGNTAPTGPDIGLNGAIILRNGVNLIGNNNTVATPFPAGSPNINGDYVGDSTIPLDPLLAPLANNGGPTQTRRLLPGSPALNRSLSISEIQLVEVGGPSSNQFRLTFGAASTPLMANNASATTVQSALNALSTINTGGGSVTVAGGSRIFLVIFSGGPLAGVNQPTLTGTGTSTTTVTVSTLVDGGNPFTTDQRGFPIVGLADIGAYESGARTLAPIADRAILVNTNTGAIPFSIGTAGTAAAPLTLTATSGNLTLVPNANAVLGGSGVNRTVTVTPAANQTGTATLTLTVTDGYDPSSTSFNVTVLPNTGFNTWKLAQFGNNATNPAIAGDTADADNDGQNTFLEYATRGLPLAPSTSPFSTPQPSGSAYQFSFPWRPGVTDLRYIVQRSSTLSGWTEIYRLDLATNQITEQGNVTADENSTTQIITVTDPDFTPGGSFWKLIVERP